MKANWTLGGMTWTEFGKRLLNDDTDLLGRSAALSYYFLLAIGPMLLCLTAIIGFVMGANTTLVQNLNDYLSDLMPTTAFELVKSGMHDIRKNASTSAVTVGFLAALWAASSGVGAIAESLNASHHVKETRPWWMTRLLAVGLTLCLALLVLTALSLVLYGGKINDAITVAANFGPWFGVVWKVLQWPIIIVFVLLALALLFYLSPNLRGRTWAWITPGSVVGTTLWLLASFGFRVYLHYFDSYSATYGSLGAVIVLMLWLYLTSVAILLGGRVNSEIERAMHEQIAKKQNEKDPAVAPQISPIKEAGKAEK